MSENQYRTGQAAKEWGVSSHQVRRLCEAGLIEAEYTGRQWRIPESEVNRVKREGVPPVPQALDGDRQRVPDAGKGNGKGNGNYGLLAPPSDDVVEAAEDVAIAENLLKRRKIDRELEETEDWFRERDEREAQRLAEQQEAERERRERAAGEQERREWTDRWIDYALRSMPWDAPQEIRPDVQEQVEAALAKSHPNQSDYVVRQIVDGAVERALLPWKRNKERQKAIADACEDYGLPWDLRYREAWKHRLQQAASAAVEALPDTATKERVKAEAATAIAPLVRRYDHQQRCQKIVSDAGGCLPSGATYEERQEAEELVREALAQAQLPVGASDRQIEKVRNATLQPICATVAEREQRRQDQRMRESVIQSTNIRLLWGMSSEAPEEALTEVREALAELPKGTPRSDLDAAADGIIEQYKADQEREKNKQRLIEAGLTEIYPYLLKLEKDYEFDKGTWALEQEIKPAIREALEAALEGDEDAEELARLVRRLVREELEL